MKKRIANKIAKRIYLSFLTDFDCFFYYTWVDICGKHICRLRPHTAVYSRKQFEKALKVLKEQYPKYRLSLQGTPASGNPRYSRFRLCKRKSS